MWAAKNGHDKIVEFLILRKANLNSTGGWVSNSYSTILSVSDPIMHLNITNNIYINMHVSNLYLYVGGGGDCILE